MFFDSFVSNDIFVTVSKLILIRNRWLQEQKYKLSFFN